MIKTSLALKVAIPLALISLNTQTVQAADGVELTESGLELTVTANRRVESLDKTLASVTVITRKQIEETQTQDLVDLLRQQRGISVARTGGPGSQTSLFIRGAESDQILVLLDGVRIASTTTGFDWSQLPIDQIDRVEIVRGPRAALYGSDAIGGVVEITTRKNSSYISTSIGKNNTKKVSVGLSGSNDKIDVSMNLSKEKSDGFSAQNKNGYSFEADDDAHEKTSISFAANAQLNSVHKAGIKLFQSEGFVEFDSVNSLYPAFSIIDANTTSKLETAEASLNSEFSEKWSQKISVSNTENELKGFSTKRNEVNWLNNLTLSGDANLLIGANYRDESGETGSVPTNSIINKALFANYNRNIGKLNLDASIRHDDHSQAGSKVTGQAAVGVELNNTNNLYASYGSAFRAPNINDLYYPDFGSYAGNPDLKPETSKTFEVGLKTQISKNHRLETSLFYTKVSDLINNSGINNQAINIDKATLKGLEIGYKGQFKKLDYRLDYTLLRTQNDETGKRLLRRPNNKVNLNLAYSVSNKTRLGMDAAIVSSRSDFGTELDGYSVVNLSVNHKLSKRTNIGIRLENITDEDYEYAYGFNTPGRGAFLTFTYK